MNIFQSLLLGAVQGVTEFLPVSSSGHLVLIQKLIPNFSQPGIVFDVMLHLGTLFSVFYFFREKILKIKFNYIYLILIGTIPAVLAGLFFQDEFESMFANPKFLGFEFLITAIINFLIDKPTKTKSDLSAKNSFFIGIAQAVAILPAISRSGATIFAGVFQGVEKKKAAEFSFLLSIPAILGANVLEIVTHRNLIKEEFSINYIAGFVTAFIFGFLSIAVVIKYLKANKFKIFGYYCLFIAALIFFLS